MSVRSHHRHARRPTHRTYSDAERLTALELLDANRGNVSRTSRETGVPAATLNDWRAGRHLPPAFTKFRDLHRGDVLGTVKELVWTVLGALDCGEKLAAAPLNQLAFAFAALFDKLRVLEARPTTVTAAASVAATLNLTRLTDDELEQLRALFERATPDPGPGTTLPPLPGSGLPLPLPRVGAG